MPPLPKINTGALLELATELRFAPRSALLRDIDRAEALAGEIDEGVQYPADWVVYRVTGYRPDVADPALIPGGALLGDLSALVERLCDAAGLVEDDLAGGGVSADEVARRWNVSRKTLSRWRRRGLIARRVHGPGGSTTLVFTEAALGAFAAGHAGSLSRAAGFSRIDARTAARMVERARRYHESLGMSSTQVVERLAARFGRSKEGVRQVLRRSDAAAEARGGRPIFGEARSLGDRDRRVIERAWRRGIEPGRLVRRFGRTRAGIHLIVNEQRLARLVALDLGTIAPRARALDERGLAEVLDAAPLRAVSAPPLPGDMIELLGLMRERVVPVGVEERAWSRAEHGLRARAARLIGEMAAGGVEARLLDRAETDLRWAAKLRAALARPELLLVLETLETTLGGGLDEMRGRDARRIVEAGLAALRAGVDAFDPWKSGRLAAPVGLMVSRVRPPAPAGVGAPERARVRMLEGTAAPGWAGLVSPWALGLAIDRRAPGARGELGEELWGVLVERYGLGEARARTLEEVAAARGITVMQAGRLERRALRAALEAARGGASD